VAADGVPSGFASAANGRLHDPGAASGDHRIAPTGQLCAEVAGEAVVAVLLVEARRTEHRDRGPDVVERAATTDELLEHAECAVEIHEQVVAPAQQSFVG